MRPVVAVFAATLFVCSCNSDRSPAGPSPVAVTPPVVLPPVVVPPVVVTPPAPPPPVFPPNDPRFDRAYYRQLVHNEWDGREVLQPLRRQLEAPRIYLRTIIDDNGAPIDADTLNQTAAALASVAASLTGSFGLAGIERGTETREGQRGWITVRWAIEDRWSNDRESRVCGRGYVGGDLMILFPRSACRCGGGPAVSLSTVKHELGHVLGFWHTNSLDDLMYPFFRQCDLNPSDREKYHAAVAYTRPVGTLAP